MKDSEPNPELLKAFEPVELERLDDVTQMLVHSAKSVFNELGRLIKSITLYGAEHQSSLNFRLRFFEVMTQALSKGDEIKVEVQTYALVIAEQIIYEDPKVEGNFIYRFYTDGIRELRFTRGVSSEEIDKLLNIFLIDWSQPTLFEDDAVTMLWSQKFEHIFYEVATRYDEDTQEADEHLFNFTDELNRLSDYCRTANDHVSLAPARAKLTDHDREGLANLEQISRRELLEKLISLTHETQSGRELSAGADRFVQLLEQLAQLFASQGEIGELERMIRQGFFVANERQREQLVERWAVPIFMQQVLSPLSSHDHPLALSSLACIQLIGSPATPYVAKALGETAESHFDVLSKMMSAHLDEHPVELCRVVKTSDYLHNKKLIPLLYASQDDSLCLKVFQTGWRHDDQGVRYEALLGLPERLYHSPQLTSALIEGLEDPHSKIRTLSSFRLSKLQDPDARTKLKEYIEGKSKSLVLVDIRKLYAALAMMGENSDFFAERWNLFGGTLKLSSLTSKGRDEGHSALIGLALSQGAEAHRAHLEKLAAKKFGGGSTTEAAQWGLDYLESSPNQKDQMVYELFFRSQLLTQRKGKS